MRIKVVDNKTGEENYYEFNLCPNEIIIGDSYK